MSTITIKDLPDSMDLDRQAMSSITGGARLRGRQPLSGGTPARSDRIIDYPAGLPRSPLGKGQVAGGKSK